MGNGEVAVEAVVVWLGWQWRQWVVVMGNGEVMAMDAAAAWLGRRRGHDKHGRGDHRLFFEKNVPPDRERCRKSG